MTALISVVIPAYNLPEYTQKTIDSIVSQTYRPIEIIISDDNSPTSLKSLIEAIKYKSDAEINIKYFRQKINLGYYWNLQFVIDQAVGKYLVLLDHDDWLIDPNFFSEATCAMESKLDCFVAICNTLLEKSPYPFMDIYYENWHYIKNGGSFIQNNLFKKIHPSRSAVMMRFDKLRELEYKNYFIDKDSSKSMNIHPDEAFVLICLLASLGSVALSGRIVSIRGEPIGSLSRTVKWSMDGGGKTFAQHFLLYEYFKKINCREGAVAMLQNIINIYPVSNINIDLLRYLKFKKFAVILMIISFFGFYMQFLIMAPKILFLKLKYRIAKSLKNIVRKYFKI